MQTKKKQERKRPVRRGKPRQRRSPPKEQVAIGSGGALLPKGDIRSGPKRVEVLLASSVTTVAAVRDLQYDTMYWTGIGYVSTAIQKGYLSTATLEYYPWYAAVFVAQYLYSCATGGTVLAQKIPKWLLCLGHSIKPKSAPFSGGSVSYSSLVEARTGADFQLSIGNLDVSQNFTLQSLAGPTINGFPTAGWTQNPPDYTDELGSQALNEVAAFMMTRVSEAVKAMSEIVSTSESTPFEKDVSTFALFQLADGVGCTGLGGGIYGQLQHEVPVWNPIVSLIAVGDDTADNATALRNFNRVQPMSGDPCLAGAAISTKMTMSGLREKHHPRLKPVDFGEFVDVVALWAQKVYTAALKDLSNSFSGTVPTSCPLSFQDFQLLLRNELMVAFGDSQSAVQGISPLVAPNRNFVPFTAGTTTAGIATLNMQLPIPIIENIKALRSIITPKRKGKGVNWYAPILGSYQDNVLDGTVYTVTYSLNQQAPETIPLFTPATAIYKKKVATKGGVELESVLETFIRISDGTSGSNLVAINSTSQLKTLADLWNNWIKNWNMATYSTQLGTLSSETGIMILNSVGLTRFWIDKTSQRTRKIERKESSQKSLIIDTRAVKLSAGLQPYYDTKCWIAMSSQGPILSSPYELVLSEWILPSVWDHATPRTTESNAFQKWQFIQEEPFSTSLTSENAGITISQQHDSYAARMVKGSTGTNDDWNATFQTFAASGRGGILSALAGFVGTIFPGIAPIASTVANVLGG